METIRRGSKGEAVKKWQKILGVTADGDFGSGTHTATVAWQQSKGLTADGVVGPATWAKAGVTDSGSGASTMGAKVPSASAPTDKWAYEVAKRAAPNLTEAERQYTLSVARGEGFYGRGWGTPSAATIAKSKEYGLTGLEGAGSNNWGAVQGTGSAGAFKHVDYHADGSAYTANYKRYATPEEGYLDMVRIILKPNVKEALKKRSLRKAVFAQHSNRYFELNPEKYLSAVMKNYGTLTTNVGWSQILSEKGITILSTLLLVGAVAGGTALYVYKRAKGV